MVDLNTGQYSLTKVYVQLFWGRCLDETGEQGRQAIERVFWDCQFVEQRIVFLFFRQRRKVPARSHAERRRWSKSKPNGLTKLVLILLPRDTNPQWLNYFGSIMNHDSSPSPSPWQLPVLNFVNKRSEHLHFTRPPWHTIGSPGKRTVRLHALILLTVLKDVNKSLHSRHPRPRLAFSTPHFLDESAIHSGYDYLFGQRP
jgi:hypothetical protein